MSTKVLLRIALALALALAAWGGMALVRRLSTERPATLTLPAIPAAGADRLTLTSAGDSLLVEKAAGGLWRVAGYPAAPGVMAGFFAALSDSTLRSELIAQSVTSHERLGVDSARARWLEVRGGGESLLTLLVGNHGPDFEGFYVRRGGEAEVYLIHGRLAELIDQRPEEWRNPQITAVPPESIATVEVTRGKSGWSLRRAGNGWGLAGGGAADSARAARYLEVFADLRGNGYPGATDAPGTTAVERRVRLLGAGGQVRLSLAMDSSAAGFWVRAEPDGPYYRLESPKADQVAPAESAMVKR